MKWEYNFIIFYAMAVVAEIESTINEAGKEGWEMVAIIPAKDSLGYTVFVFKRPLIGEQDEG